MQLPYLDCENCTVLCTNHVNMCYVTPLDVHMYVCVIIMQSFLFYIQYHDHYCEHGSHGVIKYIVRITKQVCKIFEFTKE